MNYSVGQILHGRSRLIGNLWIVYDVVPVINAPSTVMIARLWNGKGKTFDDFNSTRIDIISWGQVLAEASAAEIVKITGATGTSLLPTWARQLRQQYIPTTSSTPILPKGLSPQAVQKVQQALGMDLTSKPETARIKVDDGACPGRLTGHVFVPYTGLTQSFEYCTICDAKRNITNGNQ